MRGTLTNLSGNGHIRTETVDGELVFGPVVGRSFVMTAAPLTEAKDYRMITTSPVRRVSSPADDGTIVFETLNTLYSWKPS